MAVKPAVIAVDDDPPVLRSVVRDLRGAYGREYQVVGAGSGAAALDAIRSLTLRGTPVALLVVDQRMPGMTGVDLLGRALELVPDAKRVLLTAYADTDAAIRAINEVRLDHYILKPWDPPEERLFPVLTELLEDWAAGFHPAFEGVSLVGHRWSARAHAIKDYLTRNQVPYRWLDIENDAEAKRLADSAGHLDLLRPLVVLPDGTVLVEPSNREIAEKLGRRTGAALPFYDVVIVGGGPAALAAAVYGASEGLRTLMVEREASGGQAGTTSRIENYLGFPAGLSGADLARRGVAQATRLGAEILSPQDVVGIRRADPYRVMTFIDGTEVSCHAVVLATGVQYRKLDVPGAEALEGIGIFYGAAISEAIACRGLDVAVVGGGNSAGQGAVYLAGFARSVTLIVRGDRLEAGMSQYLVDRIRGTANITVRLKAAIAGIEGTQELTAVELEDVETHERERLAVSTLFLFIGAAPRTEWLGDLIERDSSGFILTGAALVRDGRPPAGWALAREPYLLETSLPGVFAAGDARARSVKRIASAVGEGSMAIQLVHQYLASL
jgi:thioredoxin reductase (NADPH)